MIPTSGSAIPPFGTKPADSSRTLRSSFACKKEELDVDVTLIDAQRMNRIQQP